MKTRIQKWGNSLALRIPKSFADEAGIQKETSFPSPVKSANIFASPVCMLRVEWVKSEDASAEDERGANVRASTAHATKPIRTERIHRFLACIDMMK